MGTEGENTPATPPKGAKAAALGRKPLPSGFATLRDVLSFLVGMAIIGFEVFLQPNVEPASIAVGLTLTGLPLVFSADERKRGE